MPFPKVLLIRNIRRLLSPWININSPPTPKFFTSIKFLNQPSQIAHTSICLSTKCLFELLSKPGFLLHSIDEIHKQIRLPPDLINKKQYGTVGEHTTTICGVYSALPFQFSIVVSFPAVVLPNQSYEMIIGTSFLKEDGIKVCYSSHTFNLCGQALPLVYSCTGLPHSKPQFFNVVFWVSLFQSISKLGISTTRIPLAKFRNTEVSP